MKCLKTISNTFLIKFFKERLGQSDISSIGDGTILGAIKYLNDNGTGSGSVITVSNEEIENIKSIIGDKRYISSIGDGTLSKAISTVNNSVSSLTSSLSTTNTNLTNLTTKNTNLTNKIGNTDISKYGSTITAAISKIGSSASSSSGLSFGYLWSNSDYTKSFSSQTITFDDSLYNYSFYSIIYKENNTGDVFYSTGLFPVAAQVAYIYDIGFSLSRRKITFSIDGDSATINNCDKIISYNGNGVTTSNTTCIPVSILGYK